MQRLKSTLLYCLIFLVVYLLNVDVTNAARLQQLASNRNVGYSQQTSVDFAVNFFGRRYAKFWIEWKTGLISFDEDAAYDTDEVKSFPNPAYKPNAINSLHMDAPLIAIYYANAKKFFGANITIVSPQLTVPNDANVSQWCRDLVQANVPDTGSFLCDNFVMISWIGSGPGGTFAANSIPRNNYQVLIATSGEESYVIFNYQDLRWHADQNNGGNDKGIIEKDDSSNFPKVGFNMGDGRRFLPLPYSGRAAVITLSEGDASAIPKSWVGDSLAVQGIYIYRISNKAEILVGSCHLGAIASPLSDHHNRLLIKPAIGYFLGGQQVTIRGQCFNPTTVYDIRFETEPEITVGCTYVDKLAITCILTEWFLRRGYIPFRLFEDKLSTKFTGNFYATIVGAGVEMQNYAGLGGQLEVENIPIRWNPQVFASSKSDHLVVSLYGYRELEESEDKAGNLARMWSEETKNPIFDHLRTIGNVSSVELDTFIIETKKIRCETGSECKRMDSGVFAVEDPSTGRRIWSRPFQLGWLYSTLDPKAAAEICHARYAKEKSRVEEDWREPISTCPCSQRQAEADFRFAREDQFLGFGDSTRCYVSYPIRGSTGASQCCYRVDDSGLLVYSNDSATPDAIDSPLLRAHYVGGFPFTQYGRVPIFSYLSTDAILKFTCCLWSKTVSPTSCSYYKEVRATKDCSPYRTPHLASAYGLGHIKTFRGTFYQFYGKGEYVLAKGDHDDFVIQARYEQVLNTDYEPVQATGITAVGAKIGCKYGSSKAYVQHTKNDHPGLYVYIDGIKQDYIFIRHRDRQILKNVIESPCITVIYEISDHVESVLLHLADGPVVRIKAVPQVLNIDVQMPDNSKRYDTMPRYAGLFGELSEDQRQAGADLFDLEGNRIVEPNEIYNPVRIETLAEKMLIRENYQSVMLWFTEGLKPLDYHDTDFKADYRKYREERIYHLVTEQVPAQEVTVNIEVHTGTFKPRNFTNAPEETSTTAPTTTVIATEVHPTTTTPASTEAPTTAPQLTTHVPHQTEPNFLSASPMNALVRRRKRREVFQPSYTETADAYDLRLTGDALLQAATKQADTFTTEYQRDLVDKQEAYCPYLNIPNAVKSTKNTRVGTEVTVKDCNPGFKLINSKSGAYHCKHVSHAKVPTATWDPKPELHCTVVTATAEVAQESFATIYIVLIALGALLVIALLIAAVIIIRNKSAKNSKTAAAGDAAAKYGVEVAYTEETSPLNEQKQPFSRPQSGMPPASPSPLSPTATTTTSGQGAQQEIYTSPVTIQPPTAFPPSSEDYHSPAPVVRQDDDV